MQWYSLYLEHWTVVHENEAHHCIDSVYWHTTSLQPHTATIGWHMIVEVRRRFGWAESAICKGTTVHCIAEFFIFFQNKNWMLEGIPINKSFEFSTHFWVCSRLTVLWDSILFSRYFQFKWHFVSSSTILSYEKSIFYLILYRKLTPRNYLENFIRSIHAFISVFNAT
jgi:hypothetical protein